MSPSRWLILIISLPGRSGTPRMRVWRALKARGAGVLRDGVYVLPGGPETEALLEEQADEVREAGGSAYVLDYPVEESEETKQFQGLFDRESEYSEWTGRITAFRDRLREVEEPEARRKAAQLRRELEAITATDYFPGEAKDRAAAALEEIEATVNSRFSPDEPTATVGGIRQHSPEEFHGRRWATRKSLWVDRVASAWLIRRFIDTKARFVWLDRPEDCPRDAIGFDFDGATFSHVEGFVTFEVLMHSFGLFEDSALAKLGALVHYLDVGGIPVPEAAGFVAMLTGAKRRCADDSALLDEMGRSLDHLYAAFSAEEPSGAPTC